MSMICFKPLACTLVRFSGLGLIILSTSLFSTKALASNSDVPTCYQIKGLEATRPAVQKELYILVDETTPLDERLQSLVLKNVGALMQAETGFVIASFSSFSNGRYFKVLSRGVIEGDVPLEVRENSAKAAVKTFDGCLKKQYSFARGLAVEKLREAMSGADVGLPKSDVGTSLARFSELIGQSSANDRLLLVVSDMLENSSVTSFYTNNNVKKLDVNRELKAFDQAKMIGNFGSARVYVVGAGLVTADKSARPVNVYRDPKTMALLQEFWGQYFQKSNATLEEFGAPALIGTPAWRQ